MSRSSRPVWLGEDKRQWDHVRVHIQMFTDRRLGAYELAIYGGVACHAETETGDARPSLETLASYAKCSVSTVQRSLEHLQQYGYIEVEHRKGKASHYRLLPPPTPVTDTGVQNPTAVTDTGHPGHTAVTSPVTDTDELEPKNENQELSTRNELWDAVLEACRIDSNPLTKTERSDVGKTVTELLAIGAEPRQVKARAGEWRKRYPTAPVTHRVLRNHWGELSSNGARREPEPEPLPIDEEGQAKLRTLVDSLAETKRA